MKSAKYLILIVAIGCASAYSVADYKEAEEEGENRSLQEFYDVDKLAFYNLFDSILFDADDEDISEDGQARGFRVRRQGLLRKKKPYFLRNRDNFIGRSYDDVKDACYSFLCRSGLNGFFASMAEAFGL